jgi:hypothetical protein
VTVPDDDDLVAAWVADELGGPEAARLAARLREDPALAGRLADHCAMDHALRVLHGARPGAEEFLVGLCARLPPRPRRRSAPGRPAWPWWLGAAAAAAALVLAIAVPGAGTRDAVAWIRDPARVEPAPGTDGALVSGSRIRSADRPVRIRVDGRTELALAPRSAVAADRQADGSARWTVAEGLLTLATTGSGAIPALAIATAHGRALITGTIVHVTTSASVSRFAVERGSVRVEGPGGRSAVLVAGRALHSTAEGGWIAVDGGGAPLRAVGALLCEEPAALRYLAGRTALDADGAVAGPGRPLDAAWLRRSLHTEGDLRPVIADDGRLECPPGRGTLAIDLPDLAAPGFRLRMEVRLDQAPGATPRIDTEVFPGGALPPPSADLAAPPPADPGPVFGRWMAVEIQALRIGLSVGGDPAWELRLIQGRNVVGGWAAGARPRLVWRLGDAGVALRGLAWSELAGPPAR